MIRIFFLNFFLNFFSQVSVLRTVVVAKLLVSGILFSISLIFVVKTVVVTKPLVSGVFLSTSLIFFFSKFYLSVLYWYMWIKVVASGIFFSKLFTFVFSVLDFLFLTTSFYLLYNITFSSLQEQLLIYQHLNHVLLFLNYTNLLKY